MNYIFVYGALKKECKDNYLIQNQLFIEEACTSPLYRLYNTGQYPCMIRDKDGKGSMIKGEIWSVSNNSLRKLDKYSNVPLIFRRDRIYLINFKEKCFGYLYYGSTKGMEECGNCWLEKEMI